ncbi:MAG: Endo-1,4-beta-xylanase A precursor [Firmicutes bacterium ADurb.Bin419]|nr:MAG: Endo-1,4-beta-xylanase A precursor [Firmicutes bacterium ADurb.Bin419]
MKAKSRLCVILAVLFIFTSLFSNLVFADSTSSIKIELDKTSAEVGDVIKASVVVDNISGFAGYQVNIKYDPSVLQAVNPETGAAFTNSTNPQSGTILNDSTYGALPVASNNILQGVLNFGKTYTSLEDYRASGSAETSGTVAVIGFKVLKKEETSIKFAETATMPTSVSGVYVADWNGNKLTSGYSIINPPVINNVGSAATPTPITVTGPLVVTPKPSSSGKPGQIDSTVVSNNSGKVTYKFEEKELETALEDVIPDSQGVKTAVLPVGGVKGATVYTQEFPKQALMTGGLSHKIEMNTAYAILTLPSNMLNTSELSSKVQKASNIAVSVALDNYSDLAANIQGKIVDRPMVKLGLKIDGVDTEWNNLESPIKVAIPYKPTEAELKTIEHIVVLQIDSKGNALTVPSGRYNESTGMVTFTTTHLGRYAVLCMGQESD